MSTITLGNLRSYLRNLLRDRDAWTDESLNIWIDGALRYYSQYFPAIAYGGVLTTVGLRTYRLGNIDTLAFDVYRCDFPANENPRRFLQRLPEVDPRFYGGPYYTLTTNTSTATPNDYVLILGEEPWEAGQYIGVEYMRAHTRPGYDHMTLSVPEHHIELLHLYVAWKALEQEELRRPREGGADHNYVREGRLSRERMELAYRRAIRDAAQAKSATEAIATGWRMDGKDRIY